MDPRVFKVMEPFFVDQFHNASALYERGTAVKKVIDDARKRVAKHINANQDEIIFCASGTEANNMILYGVVKSFKDFKPHVVISAIEHPSVIEWCEGNDIDVSVIPVKDDGIINLEIFKQSLRKETVLVSVMHVNNEIGTIMPLRAIRSIIDEHKKVQGTTYPYFRSDTSQSPNYFNLNRSKLAVDAMTLDGSKIYGPKGVGALYVHHSISLKPLILGGGQENNHRAGTENVAGIVGFAKALDIAQEMMETETQRLLDLQVYCVAELEGLSREVGKAIFLNGSLEHRVVNNINICIEGSNAELLVMRLDVEGIECSSAASCKSLDDSSASYVIEQLNKDCATSSLRFTFGRSTTKNDINRLIKALRKILTQF